MPGEVIDRPNPQPLPSNIDDHVLSLAVKLDKTKLDGSTYTGLQEFRRAANYIAAGKYHLMFRYVNCWLTYLTSSYDLPARQCLP
jgi:xylulose-5-phosphate/fructose-6-phosphate phosphoketolase